MASDEGEGERVHRTADVAAGRARTRLGGGRRRGRRAGTAMARPAYRGGSPVLGERHGPPRRYMQYFAYMARLVPAIGWRVSGDARARALDARVVELVAGVERHRVARRRGARARAALPDRVGAGRGGGARPRPAAASSASAASAPSLAPLGRRLLEAQRRGAQLLAAQGGALDVSIGPREARDPMRALRIAASHDLVLAQLRDRWLRRHRIELAFCGSAEAIDRYVAGRRGRRRLPRRAGRTRGAAGIEPIRRSAARDARPGPRRGPALRRAHAGADPAGAAIRAASRRFADVARSACAS